MVELLECYAHTFTLAVAPDQGKVKVRLEFSQHRPLTTNATYGCGARLCFLVLSRHWANTQCYGW